MPPKKRMQGLLKALFFLIAAVSIVLVFSEFVPYNMDEFSMYRRIMCLHYENNSLNTFKEDCHGYDLDFINTGIVLPLRENAYMGSLTSLVYYPLFLVWKSPNSVRFLGLVFLLLQALLISKMFRLRAEYAFLGLVLFFPYFFQHIVDTGNVGLQCLGVFAIVFLLNKWLKTCKIKYAALIGLAVFLGVWTKLTFLWMLPGLFLVFVYELISNKPHLFKKKTISQLCFGVLACLALLLLLLSLLFLSTTPDKPDEKPYMSQILYTGINYFDDVMSTKMLSSVLFKRLINPYEATHRVYSNNEFHFSTSNLLAKTSPVAYVDSFLVFLTPLVFWTALLLFTNKKRVAGAKSLIFYFAFLLTLLMIMHTGRAWAVHHLILAFPFLILCFLEIISFLKQTRTGKNVLIAGIIVFIVLNGYLFLTFRDNLPSRNDFSRIEINSVLQNDYLAQKYFYVVLDWGMYFYQALYGNKAQSVLYMEPLRDIDKISALKELSKKHNRKILFIYDSKRMSSDHDLIEHNFVLKDCNALSPDSVWKIRLELDASPENPCFKTPPK